MQISIFYQKYLNEDRDVLFKEKPQTQKLCVCGLGFFSFQHKRPLYREIQGMTTAADAKVSEVQPVDLLLSAAYSHERAIMLL